MSLYVEWTNRIKTDATSQWLTSGQRLAFDAVRHRWATHHIVCLVGPPGSGKSFIARLLERECGYEYVQDLQSATPGAAAVVLDGEPYARAMHTVALQLQLKRLVVVQRKMPADQLPVAEINLSQVDAREFQNTLFKNKIVEWFGRESQSTDFDSLLMTEATERVSSQ